MMALIPLEIATIIDKIYRFGHTELLPSASTPIDKFDSELSESFPGHILINITEFDYGLCYRYVITLSSNPALATLDETILRKMLKPGMDVERAYLSLSAVAPYALIHFTRHHLKDDGSLVCERYEEPPTPSLQEALDTLINFLRARSIRRLDPALASTVVADVKTELQDPGEATVADCLFYG